MPNQGRLSNSRFSWVHSIPVLLCMAIVLVFLQCSREAQRVDAVRGLVGYPRSVDSIRPESRATDANVVHIVRNRMREIHAQSPRKVLLHVLPERLKGESMLCPATCMQQDWASESKCAAKSTSSIDEKDYLAAAGLSLEGGGEGELPDVGRLPRDFRTAITTEAGFASEWTILDALEREQARVLQVQDSGKSSKRSFGGWAADMDTADLVVLPMHQQSITLAGLKVERKGKKTMVPSRLARVCIDVMAQLVRRVLIPHKVAARWERTGGADFVIVTGVGRGIQDVLHGLQPTMPKSPADGPGWNLTMKHLAQSGMDWREWAMEHARWAWRDRTTCKMWVQHVFGLQNAMVTTVAPSYALGVGFRSYKDLGTVGRYGLTKDHPFGLPMQDRTVTMMFVGSVLYKSDEMAKYSQGVRQAGLRLYGDMTEEADGVVYVNGRVKDYNALLQRTKFCLYLPGWHPNLWSHRLVDMLVSGCIPVVVQDNLELPLQDLIPWHLASLRVNYDVFRRGKVLAILRGISDERAEQLRDGLKQAAELLHFAGAARDPGHRWARPDYDGPSATEVLRAAITKRYVDLGIETMQQQG